MQRSLLKLGYVCDIWGMGHDNFKTKIDFDSYDIIINSENYDNGWLPNLSNTKSYKIMWSIDAHCRGIDYYLNQFNANKYQLMLQATKDFVIRESDLWFPNCFDDTLITPLKINKRADVGFCGNICNRSEYITFLKENFNFISDIFVIGKNMVEAINSYKIHFNKNIANDINYRSFETIGCHVPLITNYNYMYEELGFKDGFNCMFYSSYDELKYKIGLILKDEGMLNNISLNGYELSKKHTYNIRVKELMEFLKIKV